MQQVKTCIKDYTYKTLTSFGCLQFIITLWLPFCNINNHQNKRRKGKKPKPTKPKEAGCVIRCRFVQCGVWSSSFLFTATHRLLSSTPHAARGENHSWRLVTGDCRITGLEGTCTDHHVQPPCHTRKLRLHRSASRWMLVLTCTPSNLMVVYCSSATNLFSALTLSFQMVLLNQVSLKRLWKDNSLVHWVKFHVRDNTLSSVTFR